MEDWAVVYTDGACTNNQDERFRRARVGIPWCEDDGRNRSFALPGKQQSNQRAELYAVLQVLEDHHYKINVHPDSQYVYDGIQHNMHFWKREGWKVKNADLWIHVHNLLVKRPHNTFALRK